MPLAHALLFYRSFVLLCSAITIFQCVLMANATNGYFGVTLFWTKLVSSLLIGVLFHFFKSSHLYFFYNLGYTRNILYGYALALDLSIWAAAITLTYYLL